MTIAPFSDTNPSPSPQATLANANTPDFARSITTVEIAQGVFMEIKDVRAHKLYFPRGIYRGFIGCVVGIIMGVVIPSVFAKFKCN